MPDSNARRERLASPLALLLLGGLFGLAFVALMPGRDALHSDVADTRGVDAVDVAYLRARAAAGEPVAAEAGGLVRRLLEAGRPGQARTLLETFPDAALDARTAFLLELEGAATALVAGNAGAALGAATDPALADALGTRLARLRDEPGLQDPFTLARGIRLSQRLDRPALTATLHARLADADPGNASHAWAQCGRYAAAGGARLLAVECYRNALAALAEDGEGVGDGVGGEASSDGGDFVAEAFDLRLALLPQLVGAEDAIARSATAEALLAAQVTDAARLEALAEALLAAERPGDAATVHGRLAELDPGSRLHWWAEAARWDEAAGRPVRAASWLDRMAGAAPLPERAALHRRVEALLVAAGRELEALERLAARIESSPGDVAPLRGGVALALRSARPDLASTWNEALLERLPDDREALDRAIDIALAGGDLATARAAAERAVHRRPEHRASRVRLAQIAEWSGDPEVAAAQWRRLAASDADGATLRELIRLARLTRQPGIAADAARQLASLAAPSDADVRRLVELYELDGRPDAAAAALEEILLTHGGAPATLAALARLHERHGRLPDALDAWDRRAALAGADVVGTLARVSLRWRLNERDTAGRLAESLRGADLAGVDGSTAVLLSEIAWRDRRTWLAAAVAPAIATLEEPSRRTLYGRRLIDSLRDEKDFAGAIAQADRLWRATGEPDFAITAMTLAKESGDVGLASAYLVADALAPTLGAALGDEPAYWTAAAALRLSEDDVDAARRDYERALALDPDDPVALGSLVWLLIDAGEREALRELIEANEARAVDAPQLWSAFAVARLGLGEPEASLAWFERLSERIGTDYALLLGYADALESSGRVDDAIRVRRHAFGKLRPALQASLGEGSANREELLRAYAGLASRHHGLDERWSGVLLGGDAASGTGADPGAAPGTSAGASDADRWREDVAIAWLLSSERHEHARLVMARLHGARTDAPAWQALSVALAANDIETVSELLASGASLSAGDRILALRAVGAEREAFALASEAMRTDAVPATRDFAADQYVLMRRERPSWAEGFARRSSLGALTVAETGIAASHTFAGPDVVLSVEAVRSRLASDTLDLDGRDERGDVRVSLRRGGQRRGLRLEAGIGSTEAGERLSAGVAGYLRGPDGRRELAAELALSEVPTESPELRLGAWRDRASLSAEGAFGNREYARLRLDATELRTRADDELIARGLAGYAEIGMRGALGGSEWSVGVQASRTRHERADALPDGLAASTDAGFDSVLAPRGGSLGLGGSIVRGGGVGTDFPRTGAPRWFVDGALDRDWRTGSFGLRAHTGLGIRVLGGDELAFTFSHDTRATAATGADGTAFGLAYRFHF